MYDSIDEIEALIGTAEESIDLEFKSGSVFDRFNDRGKAELVKDVTAFANAGGGTIIFGIQERVEDGRAIAGEIEPVTNIDITKDRIAQIISSNTDPVFRDFKTEIIPARQGGNILVIRIEQGDTAYQNRLDLKYYHRVEATAQPMYGYAIRDVMNRRTHPVVNAKLIILYQRQDADLHQYQVIPQLINDGAVTAHHWKLYVDLPSDIAIVRGSPAILSRIIDRGVIQLDRWSMHRFEISSDFRPTVLGGRILPGETKRLDHVEGYEAIILSIPAHIGEKILELAPPLRWQLYVDDARKREEVIPFGDWCRW